MRRKFRGKTVLLVEDDPISLRFMNLLLKKYGFIIISASNGNLAVELFKKNKIDIVLLDIQVPGLDGFIVSKLIKEIDNSVPVIAQSANDVIEFKDKCIDAGCDDYIPKPICNNELTKIIERHL